MSPPLFARTGATARAERDTTIRPAAIARVWTGAVPLETIAVPGVVLGPSDALVEIELATVCGSDVHTIAGHRSAPTPLVLGHEYVGRVTALGSAGVVDVAGEPVRLGDRIVWGIGISCGQCDLCRRGLTQKCRALRKYGHERIAPHWELSGGFATHAHLLAGTAIVPVGEQVPARVAAPAACGGATAWAALRRAEREVDLDGALVLITGAGLVGLSATAMAADRGAEVIVSDPSKKRRRLAARFGAAETVDPADADALSEVLRERGRAGVDVAVEASGVGAAVGASIGAVDVGGIAVLVGSVSPGPVVGIDPERLVRGLVTVAGVHNYTGDDLRDTVRYLRRASPRRPFEDLVDPIFALRDLEQAIELAGPGGPVRVGIGPRR